jgi:hypothetical protein
MQYFAECFQGKREFKLAEVRQFELVPTEAATAPEKVHRTRAPGHYKANNLSRGQPFKAK